MGIAARRNGAGETLVYMVSDNNFNGVQRTLLLMFALDPKLARPAPGCGEKLATSGATRP